MPTPLFYSAYAVKPSRLPTYAGDPSQQVTAWTAATGGTQITALWSDAAATIPITNLVTDATGSFSCYINSATTVDDVIWFAVTGSSGPRFPVGPTGNLRPLINSGGAGFFPVEAGTNQNFPRPDHPRVEWFVSSNNFPNPDFIPYNLLPGDRVTARKLAQLEPPLPNLGVLTQARYRMSSLTGYGDGDPVALWPDSSGNTGNDLTSSGSLRPLYRAATAGRAACLEFGNGASLSRMFTSAFNPTLSQPGWMRALVKFTALSTTTTPQTIFGPDWGIQQIGVSGNPTFGVKAGSVPKSTVTVSTSPWYDLHVNLTPTGPNSRFYIDAVADTSVGSPGSTALTQFIVGGQATTGGAQQLRAYVAELGWGVLQSGADPISTGYISAFSQYSHTYWVL